MRWLKRDRWKVGMVIAGLLLLLVLMVWVPVSAAGAYEGTLGLAKAGSVQAIPTADVTATMTALNEEKLGQEIQQLKEQNGNQNNWLANNSTALIAAVATVVVALFGILQWAITARQAQNKDLSDRENERQKEVAAQDKELRDRAEERFKTAVAALGDEKEGVQVGGAILLRSFLNPEDKEIYGRYYTQIFDLAVAHLRISGKPQPQNPSPPLSLTPLRIALIAVLKEAFPLARERLREQDPENQFNPRSLDASHVNLDNAYLAHTDLKEVWMPNASLRGASLEGADFTKANLADADFREAQFRFTDFTHANLEGANLSGIFPSPSVIFRFTNLNNADLHDANLSEHAVLYNAQLNGANLARAILTRANLTLASFSGADLSGADLSGAIFQEKWAENFCVLGTHFRRANLSEANLSGVDMEGVYLNDAILRDTKMHNVRGLTKEQVEDFEARGAIVDAAARANASQPPVSPPSQSTNAQAPSAPPAQVNTLPPNTDAQR